MLRFLLKRIGQMVLILFIFATMTFFILEAMPGDITNIYVGNPKVTPEALEAIKARFGLDQPAWVQYTRFIKNIFTGDLGVSYSEYPTPVWNIIKERLPRTFVLFFSSTIVSFYIGFVLGKIIAWRRGKFIDAAATTLGITFYTAFYPLVAFVCIWAFAFSLHLVPLNGFINPSVWLDAPINSNIIFAYMIYTAFAALALVGVGYWAAMRYGKTPLARKRLTWGAVGAAAVIAVGGWAVSGLGQYVWDITHHLMMPIFVLSLISFGGTMLLTRDSMLETTREDYVMAARAKGLPDKLIRDRYAARTALLPVVTSLALSLGGAISGGMVTETLFSWPGLGLTLLQSSLISDYPLAIGAFLFTGVFILVAHLVADILNALLDPRLRTGSNIN